MPTLLRIFGLLRFGYYKSLILVIDDDNTLHIFL